MILAVLVLNVAGFDRVYAFNVRRWIELAFGDCRVDAIGTKDVWSWFDGIATTHPASATTRWRGSLRRVTSRPPIPTSRRPTAGSWRCGRTVPAARRWCGQ